MKKMNSDYPEFLRSFEYLQQHFRAQMEGPSSTEKGNRFAHFVQRLVPQTEAGAQFGAPELNAKMSGDGGVDLLADSRSGEAILYIQSKFWVDRAETIDSVISKFQAYTRSMRHGMQTLFDTNDQNLHFMLVTLSPLSGILDRYEKAEYASIDFYRQCDADNRIHFVDGHQILSILRAAYGKLSRLPNDLVLNFTTSYMQMGNVYVGIISNAELKALYAKYGDALFFENVRDFLGVPRTVERLGRTTPNNEIVKTITEYPNQMLARNNGIVFGAQTIEPGGSATQLVLKNGSVVNGCQTTMCMVEYGLAPSHVLVKAVQTEDAWDITKAANYQTSVADMDLELARFLRPQLVKRAATSLGVQIDDKERSAFQIIDQIYDRKVAYDETRLLYIGLFSRSPNNVFASNYTELMYDLINRLYDQFPDGEYIFDTLFVLQGASQIGLREAQSVFVNPAYAGIFERLYKQDSLSYRCFLSILALCGAVNINITERESDPNSEFERMKDFLAKSQALLTGQPERFAKYYKRAVKIWMQDMLTDEDEAKVRRDMYIESKRSNFNIMYRKLCMEADLDATIDAK